MQHYLLDSFGTESSRVPLGGIPFELWKRFYYPNIRDQLVAKVKFSILSSEITWFSRGGYLLRNVKDYMPQ